MAAPGGAAEATEQEEPEPKTVLCFGDSNTWGAWGTADKQRERIPYKHRWTTVLQRRLGNEAVVIPEGLNGRTTALDDPVNWANSGAADGGASASGRRYLLPCLNSHKPVDVVVLALGCNDLKTRFNLNPGEIARCCGLLVHDIKHSGCGPDGGAPKIVLVSPPHVEMRDEHHFDFGPKREEKSLATIEAYRALAEEQGLPAFVSLEIVPVSEDGLHYDIASSHRIGAAVANAVGDVLGKGGEEPEAKRQRLS